MDRKVEPFLAWLEGLVEQAEEEVAYYRTHDHGAWGSSAVSRLATLKAVRARARGVFGGSAEKGEGCNED